MSNTKLKRLRIIISGKPYFITQFTNAPIKPFKDTYAYTVTLKNKKYIFDKILKGQNYGLNYQLFEGKDGKWWMTKRIGQKKFVFIPADDVLNNDYVNKLLGAKTVMQEEKEFNEKTKEKKGFWENLNTTLLIGLAALYLLKK